MSRKYISELLSYNFVYPNNTVSEYDLEIIHDINNNSVSGTVVSFIGLLTSPTSITINMSGTWSLNGAEPYINDSGNINIFSVHMMDKTQNYYRPWSLVYNKSIPTGSTTNSFTESFTVTPSMIGVTGFTTGTYYFEVRMIGHRAVFPICVTTNVTVGPTATPSPTGTPTPTPTLSATSTPSPTATNVITPTPTGTSTPTPTITGTLTPTPTPSPTQTSLDCLCYCYTYTTVPGDLSVRWRNCTTGNVDTQLINTLETMDNGDGTFTACICVQQGSSYAIPVCVQGGIEVTCPDIWVSGSSCDGLVGPCFLG